MRVTTGHAGRTAWAYLRHDLASPQIHGARIAKLGWEVAHDLTGVVVVGMGSDGVLRRAHGPCRG